MPKRNEYTKRWRFYDDLVEEIRFRIYGGIGLIIFLAAILWVSSWG